MARAVALRFHRPIPALLLLATATLAPGFASDLHAQPPSPPAIAGVVADDTGSAIPGARITVRDERGSIVRTAITDAAGRFAVSGLVPGTYSVQVQAIQATDATLFALLEERVTVREAGASPPVRWVLRPAGFAETVVVTARREDTRLSETPQKIEVIDAADIDRSVAADLTDVLKKNSGVDVVQYSGVLSGIGIRGFRPQFSGINKRSLLLIDGRPSGVTNLATLLLDDVERIEVLKGAASAIYGSSAMGGVVNVITRQSRGRIGGSARVGGGSFGASELAGRAGGSVARRVDFDVAGSTFDQRDDYRMGDGNVRPATSYKTFDGTARIGVDLGSDWRVGARANGYRGRDIMTPGDLSSGINSQGRKNLERSTEDVRLDGRIGAHDLSVTGYRASETGQTFNVTTTNPLDVPYLPYLTFESDLTWNGIQAKDSWSWSRRHSLVFGFDYEKVTSVSRSYARTGERSAPFSADSEKRTAGFYAEQTLKFREGRTVMAFGGRLDRIATETLETPLKTNFRPSESAFTVFNPSLGVKHAVISSLAGSLRGHFTIGRAFIPAEASMLTGFTTTVVAGRTQISQGNPDLKPERSTSFDAGAEWTSSRSRFDVTLFRTVVRDRFITNVIVSNPAPPDPIVVSVANGLRAHIIGIDLDADRRLGAHVGVFANATHYFARKERLASGAEQDILNVASNAVRAGVDLDFGRLATRVSGRYVQGRKDNDFNAPGFPIIDYDNFTTVDASATYRLARQHSILIAINNVFDEFYYEKIGYPLQGTSFKVSYRVGF
jgi:outer membrane receptor protein involved in Fe transport